jgi:hypothetical protein
MPRRFRPSRLPAIMAGAVACLLLPAAGRVVAQTVVASPPAAEQPRRNVPPEGYRALFNGKDLAGWRGMGTDDPYQLAAKSEEERAAFFAGNQPGLEAHWSVVEGNLVNDGEGPYATTIDDFGDIELLVEYKIAPRADSGIYLRATPQVQIWDPTAPELFKLGADKGSGGLWNNSPGAPGKDPLVLADKPFNEWNRFRIVQTGARTSVWLNDRQVVDHALMENYWNRTKPLLRRGPIQLQTHGGEICWRNVFVRELAAEEANAWLRERSGPGFEPVFNGTDFSGWAGPLDTCEIVAGAIRCKPGQGGTIFTAKEYGNFKVQLEFRLPPGGNNGLAIRYPGSGNTAYVGMCELQVLDSESPEYAGLDPRQYHGSAYGMVPAERGYLRPTGEWNYQEVTVDGSRITVELNGSVILDTDLADAQDFMDGTPHPGKDRPSGHFGLAGHNDPVEFRNIAIKPR